MMIEIPVWIDDKLVPFEKLAAHEQGLRHKAVSVFVFRDGDLLIQRRAKGKYHTPGLWANTCCTHPEWDEDGLTCAVRRLDEELGLTGVDLNPRGVIEYRAEVGEGLIEHEVVELFIGEASEEAVIVPNPSEVMDVRWIPVADLEREIAMYPDRFTPWLRIYMAEHGHQIMGEQLAAE